jgi:hypothetical protein
MTIPPQEVRGGSAGLEATYRAILALATTFDTAGDRLRHSAAEAAAVLGNGDLLESAILAPISFTEAEASLGAASGAPDGALVASLGWEAEAVALRVIVAAYATTDELVRDTFEVLDYALGRALGFALGSGTLILAASAGVWAPHAFLAYAAFRALPPEAQAKIREEMAAGLHAAGAAADAWASAHPDLVQHVANGGGGLADGFWDGLTPGVPDAAFGLPPFEPTLEEAAQTLVGWYPRDGAPILSDRADLGTPDLVAATPDGVEQVIARLDEVNQWSDRDHPENNGTIAITSWTDPSGQRHHIVYLPGTDDLHTLPWTMDDDIRDLPTNLLVMGDQETAYGAGIVAAMHAAGIKPDDPVLLAGHSQGGMEAVWIAHHHPEFAVAGVVTAGAPIAHVVSVGGPPILALESTGDLVPQLDGEANPPAISLVTVTFDDDQSTLVGHHSLSNYTAAAAGVDGSPHPSLLTQLDGLRDRGFLLGESAVLQTHVVQITRGQ